jgi:Flp pilus assembly pilin Flp
MRHSEGSRHGAEHRPEPPIDDDPPGPPKGGELVLKLFAFARESAVSTTEALRQREEGQTMAEYGVVLAVITPAIIAAISLLSSDVRNAIEGVAGILP